MRTSTRPYDAVLSGESAWQRDTLQESAWRVAVPADVLAELDQAVQQTRDYAGTEHLIDLQPLQLKASRRFAAELRSDFLDAGPMFAVVGGLPREQYDDAELRRAYWLLSRLVSRPVQQTFQGAMSFDVLDTGLGSKMVPGSGIRATVTNLDLNFHNDNCFNTVMPDYVGLLCLNGAEHGGTSKAISFHTLHNILRERFPDALERLYQPIWWDRHREFGEDEQPYVANPVFDLETGRPRARFSNYNIRGGYKIRDEAPDEALEDALRQLLTLLATPELQCQFLMQPGEIQYVNNRAIAHARSEFHNGATRDKQRHLVRLWMRDWGAVSYSG